MARTAGVPRLAAAEAGEAEVVEITDSSAKYHLIVAVGWYALKSDRASVATPKVLLCPMVDSPWIVVLATRMRIESAKVATARVRVVRVRAVRAAPCHAVLGSAALLAAWDTAPRIGSAAMAHLAKEGGVSTNLRVFATQADALFYLRRAQLTQLLTHAKNGTRTPAAGKVASEQRS